MEKIRLAYLDASTTDERKKVIDVLQATFQEVVPYVPIGRFQQQVAYRKELKGIVPTCWDVTLWNIEKVKN